MHNQFSLKVQEQKFDKSKQLELSNTLINTPPESVHTNFRKYTILYKNRNYWTYILQVLTEIAITHAQLICLLTIYYWKFLFLIFRKKSAAGNVIQSKKKTEKPKDNQVTSHKQRNKKKMEH